MQILVEALTHPEVQRVLAEYCEVLASGEASVVDATGRADILRAVGGLFDIADAVALERDLQEPPGDDDECLVDRVQTARTFCLEKAPDQLFAALYLLRRKLQRLGEAAGDEAAVMDAIDAPVRLIVPGLSLVDLWQQNRTRCDAVWRQLRIILDRLDQWCPSSPPPSTD